MPGLESDSQQVVSLVTDVDIPQIPESSVDWGSGEARGEVVRSKAHLPHIEIADAVIGISWRGKRTGGEGKISVVPAGLV